MRATVLLVNYVLCLAGDTARMWSALNSSLSGSSDKDVLFRENMATPWNFSETAVIKHLRCSRSDYMLHHTVGNVGDATQGDANAPNGTSRIIDLLVSASMPPALRCCHSNTARAHAHTHTRRGGKGRLPIGQVSLVREVKNTLQW